ncbi:hypothetical protein JXL19_01500, partial [bacterium]|nr:hypothetical protein [bacterium]
RTRSVERNIQHIKEIFQAIVYKSSLGPSFFKDKTLIEIGPGDTLGLALMFIASGCKKIICVDRFKCVQHSKKHAIIYNSIINELQGG